MDALTRWRNTYRAAECVWHEHVAQCPFHTDDGQTWCSFSYVLYFELEKCRDQYDSVSKRNNG